MKKNKPVAMIRKCTACLLAAILLSSSVAPAAFASEASQAEQAEPVQEDSLQTESATEDTEYSTGDESAVNDEAATAGSTETPGDITAPAENADDGITSAENASEETTSVQADGNIDENDDSADDSETEEAEDGITEDIISEETADNTAVVTDDESLTDEEIESIIAEQDALNASTQYVSGDYTYTLSSSIATIVAYSGNASNLTLPSKLDGYNVYYVNTGVFASKSNLRSVTIPSSYRRIGSLISESATGAFENCTKLQSITFEGGSIDFVIGYNTFKNCTALTSVTIPGNCTKVLSHAFKNCSALTTVSVASGSASLQIGDYVFEGCGSLATFTANNTLASIGVGAFRNNDKLKTVQLGNSLATIGGGAFYDCDALESITIPASIVTIGYNRDGDGAFEGCGKLATVNLTSGGHSAAYLGYSTFMNCPALQEITIPGNYSNIADSAFRNCTALTTVTLSNGNTDLNVGKYVFSGCTALTTFTGSSNLRTIGENAFYNDTALTTLTLREGLTTIDGGAFFGCTGLNRVTIPSTVTQIGYNWDGSGAFQNCTGLTSLTLQTGTSAAVIGFNAFKGCSALQGALSIPGNYKKISDKAFQGCSSLTHLTYSQASNSSITQTIGASAFADCTSLQTVSTSGSLREIGESAFAYDSSLNTLNLSSGLTKIADAAFMSCTSLTIVTIPASVTQIGNETSSGKGAFRGCTNLIAVLIENASNNVTGNILGYNVFTSCTKLTAVYIPKSYTNIVWGISWKGLPRLTIWGKAGSAAESFANEHDIPFNAGELDPSSITIPIMDDDVFLKTTSFVYDGSPKEPEVSVVVGGMKLNKGTDYTVKYTNNINVGTATAVVNGKGLYTGTVSASFTIKKGKQTIAVTSTFNKNYGDAPFNLNAQAEGTLTYKSSNTSVAAVSSAGKVTVKGVGAATITITATSPNYDNATAKVTVNVKPAASTISSLAAYNGSQIVVKYTKAEGVSGYRIQYSLNSDMSGPQMVTIAGNTQTQKTLGSLTNGKTYYVRIRTYKEVSGTTCWSNWSAKKSVKIVQNPNPVSISTLTNVSGKKMTVTWKKISKAHGYRIQYSTSSDFSSPKMVTIEGANTTSKTITGLTKGKTYYVRIRTYRTVSGTTYWSKWSAAKSVKITK